MRNNVKKIVYSIPLYVKKKKNLYIHTEEKNEDRENTKWSHFNQAVKLLTL